MYHPAITCLHCRKCTFHIELGLHLYMSRLQSLHALYFMLRTSYSMCMYIPTITCLLLRTCLHLMSTMQLDRLVVQASLIYRTRHQRAICYYAHARSLFAATTVWAEQHIQLTCARLTSLTHPVIHHSAH